MHQKGASPKGLGWPLVKRVRKEAFMGWAGVEGISEYGS